MVFSSHLFVFYFLPVALAIYYTSPRRTKHLLLTLLSYVFYGWANPYFVFLMLTSTVIDYVCGLVMARQLRRLTRGVFRGIALGAHGHLELFDGKAGAPAGPI